MKHLRILRAAALIATLGFPLTAAARPLGQSGKQPAPPAPKPAQADDAGNSLNPEFDALWKQYASAMRDRDEKRIEAGRAQRPDTSPHPAGKYFKRFKELADKDIPDAQCWVLENIPLAVSDKEEQVRLCREVYALLIPKHADMDGVYRAIGGIRRLSEALGEAEAVMMLQKIVDSSTNAEVRAQALFGVAWLKSGRGLSKDPVRLAEAGEIRRQVVLAFPGTKAAKDASAYVLTDVEQSFLQAERAWVAEVAQLVAAKRPIAEWPKQPMHLFESEFQPLADAGHLQAKQWVKFIYPDYVLIEKQGPEIALTWLVENLGYRYPNDYEGWVPVRLEMLRQLYLQYPTGSAPWMTASLASLAHEAQWLPFPILEPVLKPLFENNQDSKVRGLVLFATVKSLMRSDDPETNLKVRALLQEILDNHAEEDVAREAGDIFARWDGVMPGATAPDFFVYDSARIPFRLSDYRGRVVMLTFFTFTDEEFNKTIPARLELMKRLEGRPFSMLGVDVDSPSVPKFQSQAGPRGVTWRTLLTFHPRDELVGTFFVRSYPTTLVIDSEGVIRSRNAPWDEMVKVVEKLVAELEAKSPKK